MHASRHNTRHTTHNLGVVHADACASEAASASSSEGKSVAVCAAAETQRAAGDALSLPRHADANDDRRGTETAAETEHLEAAAEARCAAICGDTHKPLSFAFADIRAATFIESPYRQ